MAKATKDVQREVKETVTYALTLTEVEAETLMAVLGKVGGNSDDSARVHVDTTIRALEAAGVVYFRRPIALSLIGSLRFASEGTV